MADGMKRAYPMTTRLVMAIVAMGTTMRSALVIVAESCGRELGGGERVNKGDVA